MADVNIPAAPKEHRLPALSELGLDLLQVRPVRKWCTLALPFAFVTTYAWFAGHGYWPVAILMVAAYTFVSYGSTSHDLVHGTLGLPRWLDDVLLSVVELLGVRSGHAYRAAHLHHHARFPHDDDVEATAAHGSLVGALLSGPLHQVKVYFWALNHVRHDRIWIIGEGIACLGVITAVVAASAVTFVPLVYVIVVIMGSWTFPLITAYFPHNPHGKNSLEQTIRFRGKIAGWLSMQHLYHLEHHLYPAVPHHHWQELANRLDPYLDEAGVEAVYLGF